MGLKFEDMKSWLTVLTVTEPTKILFRIFNK
jgi:hypothetical protein